MTRDFKLSRVIFVFGKRDELFAGLFKGFFEPVH